jgi:NAD(P)-dependent dehydrogenase (short-subunit alcohol dehydrogenase family)
MGELRYDGRVAIVTGAGGNPSLGRCHAMLLAERGAKVVVNDLGVGPDGRGTLRTHAEVVAQEIVDAGGEAVADTNSVAERDTAKAVVQTALDAWGRVDILVNNASVQLVAPFEVVSDNDIQKILDVHLMGSIWMCRAVWPHMIEARYGRIVNISSEATFGWKDTVPYGAAKAGVFGLARGLALEGKKYGIRANILGPGAATNQYLMLVEETEWTRAWFERSKPEQVSPAVAYLCHEDCDLSGAYLYAASGDVVAHVFGTTRGYSNPDLTIEDVRDNLETILDPEGFAFMPDIRTFPEAAIVGKPYTPA